VPVAGVCSSVGGLSCAMPVPMRSIRWMFHSGLQFVKPGAQRSSSMVPPPIRATCEKCRRGCALLLPGKRLANRQSCRQSAAEKCFFMVGSMAVGGAKEAMVEFRCATTSESAVGASLRVTRTNVF